MKSRDWLLACCVALSGCASLGESDCRPADWYQVGYRDGLIFGIQPQIEIYTHQCRAFNVTPAEKEYMTGWVDGSRERALRVSGSECCAPD